MSEVAWKRVRKMREGGVMIRKIGAVAVAAVVGGVLAVGVSSAGTRISSPTEIDTVEAHKIQHTIDNGKAGFSVGDLIVVSDDLSTPDGSTKLGHMHEVCTVVHPAKFSLECTGTAVFSDGQIAVTGEFPPVDPDASYAITGGTGAYENVGGKMTTSDAGGGLFELDFFLVP
jgi:hypothetical protein